ncbi:MAG: glycosyl hydrolase [Rikenellaceae bacterium]
MKRENPMSLKRVISTLFIAVALSMQLSCASENGDSDSNDDPNAPSTFGVLIDDNATENTKTLFANLMKSAKEGVILGQQSAYLETNEYLATCDMSDVTGEYPLLTGGDLENLTNDAYAEESGNWRYTRVEAWKEWIKECHKRGVFVTFSWHFREPYNGDSFYASDIDDIYLKAAFSSILEGGDNHTYYKKKLNLLADFFKELTDENGELIPIIFRPFHEFNGSWFWWGVPYYATSEQFIQNWQFTVDYLRNDCQVHNLIYAFTPGFESEEEYLESYPGDDYVDILGFDAYTTAKEMPTEESTIITQLGIISDLAEKRGKVAAFTEFGNKLLDDGSTSSAIDNVFTELYLDILKATTDKNIAYMMLWYNSTNTAFTPTLTLATEYTEDYKSFVLSDYIFTSGEIDSPLSSDFEL